MKKTEKQKTKHLDIGEANWKRLAAIKAKHRLGSLDAVLDGMQYVGLSAKPNIITSDSVC